MVDQPTSPTPKRPRISGKLTLPPTAPGMNKLGPNNRAIEGKGDTVGPDMPNTETGDDKTEKKNRKKESDAEILERIRKRMDRCIAAESDNRKAAVDDRKFKAGVQWPADVAAQRNTDKRPMITNNRMKTFVHQVTNPARENRPQINISPIGDRADKEGAKIFEGLIRSIERDSHADIAYDTSLDDAVTSGWGYMRLLTDWKSSTSFDQVLVIKRVRNPFTVYLDPDRQEPDGSDARYGFVTEIIPEDQFKEDYPDAQPIPFEMGGQGEKFRSWVVKDGIRVVEYYEITEKARRLVSLSSGYVGWFDDLDDIAKQKIKNGTFDILDERMSPEPVVMYYKATALEVLEEKEWIGRWIPIIQVIGDEIDIEGKVTLSGIIRDAKDAQRMSNYWNTSMTENVALAPKTHYIMTEGQMEGHEQEWKTANTRPRPALTYKAEDVNGHASPPPQRVAAPEVPSGIAAALMQAEQEMQATTGIRFDASIGERMADESGRAIRELSRKTDIGAFHYYDNFRRSLEFLGKQIVDAIPKLYTRRQVVTILRMDDKEENITIDPMMGQAYKETKTEKGLMRYFNPSFAEWGVTVDAGPSYATRRQEAAESMMEFVKALPNTAQLVMDLIASEMDWPGADKIAARLAKAIPPQLLTADLKDIPPQIQALIQNLEQQSKQLQQQLQAAMKAMNDKEADREIDREKVQNEYEAKLLAIIAKTEDTGKKIAVEQAKFTAETIIEEMRSRRTQEHEMNMARIGASKPDEKPDGQHAEQNQSPDTGDRGA